MIRIDLVSSVDGGEEGRKEGESEERSKYLWWGR